MDQSGTRKVSMVDVKVVIEDAHLGAQDAVRAAVSAMGLNIETCFPEFGTIFGSAEESVVPRLRLVDGVQQAQSESRFSLPDDPEAPQ